MEQQRVPFQIRGGTNPNQFFSVFEREENNTNPNNPYNLDESVGQLLNRTFANSIESSFYQWDHDESNLLGDLDQLRQEQAAQKNALKNENSQFESNFLKAMKMQQQKKAPNVRKASSPQKIAQESSKQQKGDTFFPDQGLQLKQQTSQKKTSQQVNQGSLNYLHGRDDKLGETVISEYVSEDFHSQYTSPIRDINNPLSYAINGNNNNINANPSQLQGNQNQLSVLISQQEDNVQSTSQVQNEFSVLSILKEQELEKPVYLNVMVVGGQGLGKSTFIDAFLNKKFHKEQADVIRPKTEEIVEIKGVRKEGKVKIHLNMIDTPGYTEQQNLDEWLEKIIKFVTSKFELYQVHEDRLIADRKSVQQEDDKDCRIHVCLYFLQGPRISKSDLKAMLKLQDYLSIIPILAKGDCYTTEEVKEIKENIIKDAHDQKIQLFDCEAPLKNDKERFQKLKNGPFGSAPPFLMISSVQKIEIENQKYQYARKYPWGICRIEDPEHSDFLLLYQLLIGFFITDLKKLTELIYKQYLKNKKKLAKQQKQQQKKKQNQLIGGGMGVITALGIGLYSLFKSK